LVTLGPEDLSDVGESHNLNNIAIMAQNADPHTGLRTKLSQYLHLPENDQNISNILNIVSDNSYI